MMFHISFLHVTVAIIIVQSFNIRLNNEYIFILLYVSEILYLWNSQMIVINLHAFDITGILCCA